MYKEHFKVKRDMAAGKFIGAMIRSKGAGKAFTVFFIMFLLMIAFTIIAKKFGVAM